MLRARGPCALQAWGWSLPDLGGRSVGALLRAVAWACFAVLVPLRAARAGPLRCGARQAASSLLHSVLLATARGLAGWLAMPRARWTLVLFHRLEDLVLAWPWRLRVGGVVLGLLRPCWP
eukprot:9329218-Alexandrium_andersonii.AAC.1